MLGLSVGLFLEQLVPMDIWEDDNPSTLEKLDLLNCLSDLLSPKGGKKSMCDQLDPPLVRNLSVIFFGSFPRG
jgi:hypothetical protein